VPPPPQAEAKNILLSARVVNNFDPAGTIIGFSESPFISIDTLPVETNCDLARMITTTNNNIIPLNETTPKNRSILMLK
jgi:hypothetical protein